MSRPEVQLPAHNALLPPVVSALAKCHAAVMDLRDAIGKDAGEACQVMRRPIMELCLADHRQDPRILQHWLANKTPDIFRTWLNRADNAVLVTVEDGTMIAADLVTDTGVVDLNYGSPDARCQGVSRAMLTLGGRAPDTSS